MKIKQIAVWQINLRALQTYYMADNKTCDITPTTIVRIDADNGICGFGECCPIPHYLPAYAGGIVAGIGECAPVLLGAELGGVEALMAKVNAHLLGHPYVKSPIDIALWDLMGKALDRPLYDLLGGMQTARLPVYHSISCLPPRDMAAIASASRAQGVRHFQAKLGADKNWRRDVARLLAVREAAGDEMTVYGDFNCGASVLTATRVARAAAGNYGGDFMIEQPCADLSQCARVKNATGLPMKIDESAHDMASLLEANRLGCLDAVAVKLSKFGGLCAARRARDLCEHLGAQMCIEDTWGSDIVTAAALHLAAATPASALFNVCDLSAYVVPRVAPSAPVRRDGYIAPPSAPGLGVTPDPDLLGDPIAVFA